MLKWFVDSEVAFQVQRNRVLIEEEQVEVCPELFPDAIMDENVDVHLIQRYFTSDAWSLVEEVVHRRKENFIYLCKHCSHDVHESASLACDHCLSWFHIKCLGLRKEPKMKYWFCQGFHTSPMC